MRMIETFAESAYKITLFQTEDRYLLQLEDENYMLSWKVSKDIPLQEIKDKAIPSLLEQAKDVWPQLRNKLTISIKESPNKDELPNII